MPTYNHGSDAASLFCLQDVTQGGSFLLLFRVKALIDDCYRCRAFWHHSTSLSAAQISNDLALLQGCWSKQLRKQSLHFILVSEICAFQSQSRCACTEQPLLDALLNCCCLPSSFYVLAFQAVSRLLSASVIRLFPIAVQRHVRIMMWKKKH